MPAVDCRLPRLPMSATAPTPSDDPRVLLVFTNWVKVTKKWHPIIFIGISAVVGVVLGF